MYFRAGNVFRTLLSTSALVVGVSACNVDITWDSELGDLEAGGPRLVFDVPPSSQNVAGMDFATMPAVALKEGAIPDPTFKGVVTLSVYSDPDCKVPSAVLTTWNATATAANFGVASFNAVNLTLAGTYYLKAKSGSYASGCSPAFTVQAASPAALAFSAGPPPSAGLSLPFVPAPVLKAADAYGNVATSYTQLVTLSAYSDSGCATAAAGSLLSPAASFVGGQATYTGLAYNTIATIYLKPNAAGLTLPCVGPISVTTPPTDHLAITTQPAATATAGVPFPGSTVVRAEDAGNALTSAFSSAVTLGAYLDPGCLTAASGSLTGTTAAAVAGTATFSGVTFSGAGSIYLKAQGGAFSSACSTLVNVGPGVVTQLFFSTAPSTSNAAGAAFGTQPTILAIDANSNLNPSYATPVTLSAFTNSGCTTAAGGTLMFNSTSPTSGIAAFSAISYSLASAIYLRGYSGGVSTPCFGPITVNAGPATQLTFSTVPSLTNTAGVNFAIQPVVSARDSGGNTSAAYSSGITLSAHIDSACLTAAAGTLASNVNVPTGGVSTYAGLNYSAAGTIYVRATSGALTPTCSPTLTVVSGPATQLVFTTAPSATNTAGVNLAVQPVVAAQDGGGNTNAGYTLGITISAYTDSGCLTATTVPNNRTMTAATGVAAYSTLNYPGVGSVYFKAMGGGGIVSSCQGPLSFVSGPATQLAFATQPSATGTALAAFPQQPVVAARDAGGYTAAAYVGAVTLTAYTDAGCLTAAGGTLNGSPLATSGGVATFTGVNYSASGPIRLKATSGALASACSTLIAMTGASATQLAFTVQPSATATAGANFGTSPTVAAQDPAGNNDTAYTTPVTLSAYSDAGCLTVAAGVVNNGTHATAAGLSVFTNLQFNNAIGVYFKAASGALTAACSNFVNVVPGAASQLVFTTAPSAANTAGLALSAQPVVTARDANGNTAAAYTNGVTLSAYTDAGCLTVAAGTVGGSVTTIAAGIGTFSGVNFSASGGIYFKAASGALFVCSGALTFDAGVATQLTFTTSPSSVNTAGVNFLTQPALKARDAGGNVDANYSGAVTLTAYTDTGCLTAAVGGALTFSAPNSGGSFSFSNLKYTKSGTFYLKATATSPPISSPCTSAVTVAAGAATQLAITTSASATAAAGSAFPTQPVVKAVDSFGNVVTSYATNVTVAAYAATACGGGAAPGAFTSSTGSTMTSGTSNYMALTYASVPQTIYLGFTSGALTQACDSNPLAITLGAPAKLAYSYPPRDGYVGIVLAPAIQVQVQDAANNPIPTATDTITLSKLSGTGTIGGTLVKGAVNGLATFTDVTLSTAGSKMIQAASGALTNVSQNINIVAGAMPLLASAASTACSVRSNGGTYCWGSNQQFELGTGNGTAIFSPMAGTPVANSHTPANFSLNSISGSFGGEHYCGIDATSNVLCWGTNQGGQLGDGTTRSRAIPRRVLNPAGTAALASVTEVAVGGSFTCAISGGSVYCWGDNGTGQLGNGTFTSNPLPVAVLGISGTATHITAGQRHACVTTSTNAFCWGHGAFGQLGNATNSASSTAVQVNAISGTATQISAGFDYTCARSGAGGAYCWGLNAGYLLGDATSTDRNVPTAVRNTTNSASMTGVVGIFAGYDHTCLIDATGYLYCHGQNYAGQIGDSTTADRPYPKQVTGVASVTAVSMGALRTCAIAASGYVWCWGEGSIAGHGNNSVAQLLSPNQLTSQGAGILGVASTYAGSCILSATNVVRCWGKYAAQLTVTPNAGTNGNYVGVATYTATPMAAPNFSPSGTFNSLGIWASSDATGFAAMISGTSLLHGWGANQFGQIGDSTAADRVAPKAASLFGGVISTGTRSENNTCITNTTNQLYCWGDNQFGQIGDATTVSKTVPTFVMSSVVAISTANGHTCSISSGGGVNCWGRNNAGQLGVGDTAARSAPTGTPVTTAKAISTGHFHTCAALANGQVQCWGDNSIYQLGDGTTAQRTSPVTVVGVGGTGNLSDIVAVATGASHTCALSMFGEVYCWGQGIYGQLGDSGSVDRAYPVKVKGIGGTGTLSNIVGIAVGTGHSCATDNVGATACWGFNLSGQLGNGTTSGSGYPVAVGGLP